MILWFGIDETAKLFLMLRGQKIRPEQVAHARQEAQASTVGVVDLMVANKLIRPDMRYTGHAQRDLPA